MACLSSCVGTIDFKEFLLAYIATTAGTQQAKYEYAFKVFDINANEVIEKSEAEKILNIICRMIGADGEEARAYMATMMLTFDQNQDNVLTKQEFVHGCLMDPSLASMTNPFTG